MMEVWWFLLGAVIPVVVAGQALKVKEKRNDHERAKTVGRSGKGSFNGGVFVCERVCSSKRLLNKVAASSKDPIMDACVTVCGAYELDACAEACAKTVCVNQHKVPDWNGVCLARCQSECLKLLHSPPLNSE
ncbi:uncharacterized protein At5g64816 [Morus notabilis]|nr:uncharacterized protein At5g64816 [Morus notabilis]